MGGGTGFHLFGPFHLAILGLVLGVAAGLSLASTRTPIVKRRVRYFAGSFLALNELAWYTYRYRSEGFRFPEGLPLQLCDLTLWLTVFSLFTLHPLAFETAYFAGLGGSGMALLTPDLWAPLCSYPTIYFFVAHGLVVACLLMLIWSKQARPRAGSLWRAFVALNAYAAIVGIFDAVFKTNYMYLCQKPTGASLMDFLGPWPWYIAGGEALALLIFCLLWLPVRRGSLSR